MYDSNDIEAMSGSEFAAAVLAPLSRTQLETLLRYLSGYAPGAMAEALDFLAVGNPHCSHDDADLPWFKAHAFIQCTGCDADACNACSRPAGDEIHQPAPVTGPCPGVAPHTGRECTLDAGHDGQHRSGNVVWDDEPQAPEPGGCMCKHPGYEHIYAEPQPCTQCECTAFAAMPVPAETAGSAK